MPLAFTASAVPGVPWHCLFATPRQCGGPTASSTAAALSSRHSIIAFGDLCVPGIAPLSFQSHQCHHTAIPSIRTVSLGHHAHGKAPFPTWKGWFQPHVNMYCKFALLKYRHGKLFLWRFFIFLSVKSYIIDCPMKRKCFEEQWPELFIAGEPLKRSLPYPRAGYEKDPAGTGTRTCWHLWINVISLNEQLRKNLARSYQVSLTPDSAVRTGRRSEHRAHLLQRKRLPAILPRPGLAISDNLTCRAKVKNLPKAKYIALFSIFYGSMAVIPPILEEALGGEVSGGYFHATDCLGTILDLLAELKPKPISGGVGCNQSMTNLNAGTGGMTSCFRQGLAGLRQMRSGRRPIFSLLLCDSRRKWWKRPDRGRLPSKACQFIPSIFKGHAVAEPNGQESSGSDMVIYRNRAWYLEI